MNQQPSGDWIDLSKLWQAESSVVSSSDIDRYLRRLRWRISMTTLAELAAAIVGVSAALWLAFATSHRWMGLITAAFATGSAVVMLRARLAHTPAGNAQLVQSLKDSIAFEDWVAEQLRFGRGLGLMALFAVVMAASVQLLHIHGATKSGLLATVAAGSAVTLVLAWNLVLTWQVRRRGARLRLLRQRFET